MTTNGHETTGTEIQTTPATRLRDLLTGKRMQESIAAVLPRHLTAERIVKVALAAASRQPLLLECTPNSFLAAVMQAAEIGLEPGSALGHGYLVPFKNHGVYECSFIPGYRGLIALARRSGEIVSIEAHVRYLRDTFSRTQGLSPTLEHTPWEPQYSADGTIVGPGDPGPLIGVYAIARLRDGGVQTEYMSRIDIEKIRMRSAKGKYNEGPWHDDYTEMARKTAVRRIFKYLPVSIELAKALELTRTVDGDAEVVDEPADPTTARAALDDGGQRIPDVRTQADTIRGRVAAKVGAAPAATAPEREWTPAHPMPKPATQIMDELAAAKARADAQPKAGDPFDHSDKPEAHANEEPAKRARKKREVAAAAAPGAPPASPTPAPAPSPAPTAHEELFDSSPTEDPFVELRRELSLCETPPQVLLVATGMRAALATMPRDVAKLAWQAMISRVEDLGIGDAENWLRDRMDPKRQPAAAPAPAADPGPDPERAAIEAEASDGAEQARLLAALNAMPVFIGGPLQFSKHYARSAATLDRTSREAYRNAARAFLRERFPKAVTSDEGADAWLDDDSTGGAT